MQSTDIYKVKPTISFHFINGCTYFNMFGSALEINDQKKFIYSLCSILDGIKTISEIIISLQTNFPEEVKFIADAINALDSAHILEKLTPVEQHHLSQYDITRWSRNTEFFSTYCTSSSSKFTAQEYLKTIKVTLLGIGGLGSHILYDLAALGVYNIKAVDFDKIELSNLNRQILYSEADIGKNKVDVARERMLRFFPKAQFEFINKKLENGDDVSTIIEGSNIVICVADKPRFEMQKWLNSACVKHKIPFITGGLDVRRAVLCTIIPGHTGCIECWKSQVQNNNSLAFNLLQSEQQSKISDIPMPAIVPLVSTLTGLMMSEFTKIVTNISVPQSLGKLLAFNFDSLNIMPTESWERQVNCKICSSIR